MALVDEAARENAMNRYRDAIILNVNPSPMFVYSLPIFFSHVGILSPSEAMFILACLWLLLFLTAPEIDRGGRTESERYLFSAWIGELSLSRVFWPYFLFLNGVLYGADELARSGRFSVSSWDDVHFVLVFTIIWWTVAVCRCSVHTGSKIWSATARFAIILVMLEYVLKLTIRIDYPRLFFNCEDLLLDYGSCF